MAALEHAFALGHGLRAVPLQGQDVADQRLAMGRAHRAVRVAGLLIRRELRGIRAQLVVLPVVQQDLLDAIGASTTSE